jgi:TPR repeat protein
MRDVDQRDLDLYDDACGAYAINDFETAFQGFKKLADSGNAMAIAYLAELYFRGEGVAQDTARGMLLLQKSAWLGNSTAAYNLGAMHKSGVDGVPVDLEESRRYFHMAKELGTDLLADE